MTSQNEQFEFYWKGPFSQWHPSEFVLDGVTFNTAEQAMMYFKAKLFGDDETAQDILGARDPGKQKALGRMVKLFDEHIWQERRVAIVTRINLAKFEQNKGLRRKLFQTGEKALVEASPLDLIWGIGLSAEEARLTDPGLWPGKNLLGQVITSVRDRLALKYPEEAMACAPYAKEE